MGTSPPIANGAHQLFFEDDLIIWRVHGSISKGELESGHEFFTANHNKFGYVVVLGDIRDLTGITPDARRVHNDWHRALHPYFSIAMLGGSLMARTLVRLVYSAVKLFSSEKRMRIEYFATEAEARAWLKQEALRLGQLRLDSIE